MKLANGDKILAEVDVSRIPSSGKTRHTVDGLPLTGEAKLRLVQLEGDVSIHLIHYSQDETELTDTCHDSVEDALEQAAFEYAIDKDDWTFL